MIKDLNLSYWSLTENLKPIKLSFTGKGSQSDFVGQLVNNPSRLSVDFKSYMFFLFQYLRNDISPQVLLNINL